MDYYDLYDITPEEEAAMEADRERDLSQSTALRDVADERDRQRLVKGWTTEHDDEHTDGEMATAAACYAAYSASSMSLHEVTALWPWGQKWWKPSNPRRDLVKAAALIVAEIERLDRASHSAPWPHGDAPSSILETVEEARKPDLNRRSVTSQASEGAELTEALTLGWWNSKDLKLTITETGEVMTNDREALRAIFDALPEVPHGGIKGFDVVPVSKRVERLEAEYLGWPNALRVEGHYDAAETLDTLIKALGGRS